MSPVVLNKVGTAVAFQHGALDSRERRGWVIRKPYFQRVPSRSHSVMLITNAISTTLTPPPSPVKDLPTPTGALTSYFPVFGETLEIMEKGPLQFYQERSAIYGPVFRTHYFGKVSYMLGDYPSVEKAMNGDHKLTRLTFPQSFQDFFGASNFMTDKKLNQILRRQVGQAFGSKALQAYSKELPGIVDPLLARVAAEGSFDAYEAATTLTLEFALRLVCGLPTDDPAAKEIIKNMMPLLLPGSMSPLPKVNLPGFPYYEGLKARDAVSAELRKLLEPKKAQILEQTYEGGSERNFMTQMLRAKLQGGSEDVTDDDVLINVMLGVMLAAFDTSKSALLSLMAVLAMAPQRVLEKLSAEQQEVIAKHGEEMTGDALADMPYAMAFVKECLRAFNATPMLQREVIQDFEVHGFRIPAGSSVLCNMIAAAAQEDCIPDHERGVMFKTLDRQLLERYLRPERYLATGPAPMQSAFGVGPHFCLGQPLYMLEGKSLVATIVRKYQLSCGSDTVEFNRGGLAVPTQPLMLKLTPLGGA